jgi:hypothetical protein
MHVEDKASRRKIRCFYWPFCRISGILHSFPQPPELDADRRQYQQRRPAFELA